MERGDSDEIGKGKWRTWSGETVMKTAGKWSGEAVMKTTGKWRTCSGETVMKTTGKWLSLIHI